MTLTVPTYVAGQILRASDLQDLADVVSYLANQPVARGRRTTDKTTIAGTELGVLRLDSVSLQGGLTYRIATSSTSWEGSDNHVGRLAFRIDTTGAAATTSSTLLHYSDATVSSNLAPRGGQNLETLYSPSSDETVSILLTAIRVAGGSDLTIDIGTDHPLDLMVFALGNDPGNTGTVI